MEEYDRGLTQCAIHLREYNNALLINDTLLMEDALCSLKDFYRGRETTIIDDTDHFLVNLFQGGRLYLSGNRKVVAWVPFPQTTEIYLFRYLELTR